MKGARCTVGASCSDRSLRDVRFERAERRAGASDGVAERERLARGSGQRVSRCAQHRGELPRRHDALVAFLFSSSGPERACLSYKSWVDRAAGAVMFGLGLKLVTSAARP